MRDSLYYTLHITPEKPFFYISFETNIKEKSPSILISKILNIFQPKRFDFIFFEPCNRQKEVFEFPDYFSSSSVHQVLECGYNITYKNFHKKNLATQPPLQINQG